MYRFSSFFFFRDLHKTFLILYRDLKKYKADNSHLKIQHCETYPFFFKLIFHLDTQNNPKISRDFFEVSNKYIYIYIATAFWKVCGELDNYSIFHTETIPTTVSHLLNLLCITTRGRSGVIKKLKSK